MPFGSSTVQTDRAIANIVWKTVPIDNLAASGDYTIHAVSGGTRFICPHMYMHSEGAVDLIFKSGTGGSPELTGTISLAAEEVMEVLNDGFGVFHGKASDDDFIVNVSGAVQLNGFAVIGEL